MKSLRRKDFLQKIFEIVTQIRYRNEENIPLCSSIKIS